MSITQDLCLAGNSHVRALLQQLEDRPEVVTNQALFIASPNPNLDATAVSRLRSLGALILRTGHEALSKSLEQEDMADALQWAATHAGVTTITLVGHSQAASIPFEELGRSFNPKHRMRLFNDRLEASRLKLKDDLARFKAHQQIRSLLSGHDVTLNAVFYLQESGMFLPFESEE